MHARDRVFAARDGHAEAVVERVVPHREHGITRALRPQLVVADGAECDVHREALRRAEAAFKRVGVTRERMHVGADAALLLCVAEDVGVRRIEAADSGALVAGDKRRNQVALQVEERDVSVERRPVLLADVHHVVAFRERVQRFAGGVVLVVEDAVVLVGHLQARHRHVFRARHHQHVLGRVVQITGIVHVHVIAARLPAARPEVDHSFHADDDVVGRPGPDVECGGRQFVLEPPGCLDLEAAHRRPRDVVAGRVEQVPVERRQPFV